VVTGLFSIAGADGEFAVGSDGVAAGRHGKIYIQETFAPPDLLPEEFQPQNGQLLKARPYGTVSPVADITAFETANDPDGYGFDSDPYAVIAYRGGHLVADAAANAVLYVSRWGDVYLFHTFFNVTTGACGAAGVEDPPGFPGCNFVPTSLATDRRGNVYVGGLSSETPGEAQVVKLSPSGRYVVHTWTGFTTVTGLAVGRDGTLWVSQLLAPEQNPPAAMVAGVVTKVPRYGERTDMDVPFPAGLAICDDNLYVSAWSVAPDDGLAGPGTSGQVWRIHI
jgi:hypothetical protein